MTSCARRRRGTPSAPNTCSWTYGRAGTWAPLLESPLHCSAHPLFSLLLTPSSLSLSTRRFPLLSPRRAELRRGARGAGPGWEDRTGGGEDSVSTTAAWVGSDGSALARGAESSRHVGPAGRRPLRGGTNLAPPHPLRTGGPPPLPLVSLSSSPAGISRSIRARLAAPALLLLTCTASCFSLPPQSPSSSCGREVWRGTGLEGAGG